MACSGPVASGKADGMHVGDYVNVTPLHTLGTLTLPTDSPTPPTWLAFMRRASVWGEPEFGKVLRMPCVRELTAARSRRSGRQESQPSSLQP